MPDPDEVPEARQCRAQLFAQRLLEGGSSKDILRARRAPLSTAQFRELTPLALLPREQNYIFGTVPLCNSAQPPNFRNRRLSSGASLHLHQNDLKEVA